MSYFRDAQDLSTEIAEAFRAFFGTDAGAQAAAVAAAGFDLGNGSPEEPTIALVTSDPATSLLIILGGSPRVVEGASPHHAHVRLEVDADTLHDTLAENYDAGQIARAVEERRLILTGPPWSMDALIVVAGAFGSTYRKSLESRGRSDLLDTPVPDPAGSWVVDVPDPAEFVGVVLAGRRAFNQTTSR